MGRGEGACYLASIITREIVTLFGDHILEASKDKSRPHLLGQIFDVKGWMAAVACPESSRGGSKCWGSGCTLNISICQTTELKGAGTGSLQGGRECGVEQFSCRSTFDRVSKTFKRFTDFD